MEENDPVEICPECGQPLKLIKSKKQHHHHRVRDDETEIPSKPFDFLEMWHCLNCNEDWENEIMKNVWKKKHRR
jgi:hypothetical protein